MTVSFITNFFWMFEVMVVYLGCVGAALSSAAVCGVVW